MGLSVVEGEAGWAQCVKAFEPRVLYPYHYRDSPLYELRPGLMGTGVELRLRDWYANGVADAAK